MLGRLNLTLKKNTVCYGKGTEKVQKQRLDFWKTVKEIWQKIWFSR